MHTSRAPDISTRARTLAILSITMLAWGCHDVDAIERFRGDVSTEDTGRRDDGGADGGSDAGNDGGSDAAPDSGPEDADTDMGRDTDLPDTAVDAGPPPPALGASFENNFLVRAATRIGEGILVIGVDSPGDRVGVNRQALAAFVHESDRMVQWAHHYGTAEDNDQFLAMVRHGDDALVLGARGSGSETRLLLVRFNSTGLVDVSEFDGPGTDLFVTGALLLDEDTLLVSGRASGDAAIFRIELAAELMRTVRLPVAGAFLGLAEHEGTLYAVGQDEANNGLVARLRLPELDSATVFTVQNAELSSVSANSSGAVAVGLARDPRIAFRMQLRMGESPILTESEDFDRFRQVDFVGGRERYVGSLSSTGHAFVGELQADGTVLIRRVDGTRLSGVSGRLADVRNGGFIATEVGTGEMTQRVQLARFNTVDEFTECGRSGMATFVASTRTATERTWALTPSMEVMGTLPAIVENDEEITRETDCPME